MIIKNRDKILLDTKKWTLSALRPGNKKGKNKERNKIRRGTLPETGRSTVDVSFGDTLHAGLDTISRHFDIVNPFAPVEVMKYLTLLSVITPDLSQVVINNQAIVNTGHEIVIQDKSKAAIKKAVQRINEKSHDWYKRSAGVDGLVNHYSNQLSISGAISSEDVLQPDMKGVDHVAIVPTFTIRARRIDGRYKYFQRPEGYVEPIPLNEITYHFLLLQSVDNSPYPVPPFLAALDPVILQKMSMKNIRFALDKLGILGLNVITANYLDRLDGESDEEYDLRNQEHLKKIAEAIKDNFSRGVLILPEGLTHANHAISTDLRGVKDLWQIIEEQLISGAKTDGALIGRGFSRTETFATVVHNMMLNQAGNQRRLIKRRHESTMRLDLLLAGMDVEVISMLFDKDKRLDPNTEALANLYDVRTAKEKASSGMVDPDDVAQEMGYPAWYDKSLIKASENDGAFAQTHTSRFKWDNRSQMYKYAPNVYDLDRVKGVFENKDDEAFAHEQDKKYRQIIDDYLSETVPFFDVFKDDVSKFALEYTKNNYDQIEKDPKTLTKAVINYIAEHDLYKKLAQDKEFTETVKENVVDAGKYYKKDDRGIFGGKDTGLKFHFSGGDKNAMEFYAKIDHFCFSSFISNEGFGGQITEFVNGFIERGEYEFGKFTKATKAEFMRRFGRALRGDVNFQMRRIVESAVGRIRAYGHISQMVEARFKYLEINAILDGKCTSGVCPAMHGKRIPVEKAWKVIQKFVDAGSVDEALEVIKKSNMTKEDTKLPVEKMLASGKGIYPFHVKCRCWGRAVFDDE